MLVGVAALRSAASWRRRSVELGQSGRGRADARGPARSPQAAGQRILPSPGRRSGSPRSACSSRWSMLSVARLVCSCSGSVPMRCFLVAPQASSFFSSSCLRVAHLGTEEVDGVFHLLLARLDRLLDEERGEPIRHLLGLVGILVDELDRETVVAADVDGDRPRIVSTARRLRGDLRVGARVRQHPLEPRAAQDLRRIVLQAPAVSSVATLGTKESGTFSDSTRIRVEERYFFGRTKRATIERTTIASQAGPAARADGAAARAGSARRLAPARRCAPSSGSSLVLLRQSRMLGRASSCAHGTTIVSPGAARRSARRPCRRRCACS